MGNGTESDVMVVTAKPSVAQESGGSNKAVPIRVADHGKPSNPLVINNKQFAYATPDMQASNLTTRSSPEPQLQPVFSERNLPVLPPGADTTIYSDSDHSNALNAIASCNDSVSLNLGEDLPNHAANQNSGNNVVMLQDSDFLDTVCRLINMRDVDFVTAANIVGKQCGGNGGGGGTGKGSQAESSTAQGGQQAFVTGYTSTGGLGGNMVSGLGGGGGAGGGGDDDPFEHCPPATLSGHYTEFPVYEEQPANVGSQRDVMAVLTTGPTQPSPMLPQFQQNREEILSCDIEGMHGLGHQEDLTDITDLNALIDSFDMDTSFVPTEETLQSLVIAPFPCSPLPSNPSPSNHPISEETQSEIGSAFDILHIISRPAQQHNPLNPTVGISPPTSSVPHSQIPGLGSSPSPIPLHPHTPISTVPSSPHSLPSPLTPASMSLPPTPSTPASSLPPTPSTPQCLLKPNSYIKGGLRLCELAVPQDLPKERRNFAAKALIYIALQSGKYLECMNQNFDLKVACDVRAVICPFDFQPDDQLIRFSLPKDCKPLTKWLSEDTELSDRLLVLQQVVNTLATIHTLGYSHEDELSLWGSFVVFVAPDLRVHLLVDFLLMLKKQEASFTYAEIAHPRRMDVLEVQNLYKKLIEPCVGLNASWLSPCLVYIFDLFEKIIYDPSSGHKMAEAARNLGERRICRLNVDMSYLPVVIYCVEQELFESSLQPLVRMIPSMIAQVWTVSFKMPNGKLYPLGVSDRASADHKISLVLQPCMHPSNTGLLYIRCAGNNC